MNFENYSAHLHAKLKALNSLSNTNFTILHSIYYQQNMLIIVRLKNGNPVIEAWN